MGTNNGGRIGTKIGLTELVLRSERRKEILLLLKDGPRSMDQILEHFSIDSVSILPQIKKLKDRNLILQKKRTYELSMIGKTIVDRMLPLLNTLEVLEDNFDYWSKRRLEGIPATLKGRIGELKDCKLIRPDVNHMFELNTEFVEKLLLSRQVFCFTSYFHPAFVPLYVKLAEEGAEISLIFTNPVFQRLKTDYRETLQALTNFENVNLNLLPDEPKLAGFTVTERFILLTVFPAVRYIEHESLLSFDPEALKWGYDLYSCFRKETIPIKEP
jgi:predicted transcriptional regulator